MDCDLIYKSAVIAEQAPGTPETKYQRVIENAGFSPEKNPEEDSVIRKCLGLSVLDDKERKGAEREKYLLSAKKVQEIGKNLESSIIAGVDIKSQDFLLAVEDYKKELDIFNPFSEQQKLTVDSIYSFPKSSPVKIEFLDYYSIPSSGIVTVGGKTGGGKTTFMINACRAYLNHNKKVVFITYELNGPDLALALALSLYAEMKTEIIPEWNRTHEGPGRRIYSPEEIKNTLPEIPFDENPDFVDTFDMIKQYIGENKEPPEPLKKAYKVIEKAIDSEQLTIIESPKNILEVEQVIITNNADAYFVDYIQVIPPPPEVSRDSYRGVQSVCDVFRKLGNKDRRLVFLGAQFNRQAGDETQKGNFDPRLEQFREAGDIEQISTLAIGIGYQIAENGMKQFFYKMLKNRFAGRMTGAKIKSFGYFEYFYAMRGGRWTPAEKWHTPSGGNRKLQENQLMIKEIVEDAETIEIEKAIEIFKQETGKAKYSFNRSLETLTKKGIIKNDEGILSCE